MPAFRSTLAWLLCALLLGAGLPRLGTPCRAAAPDPDSTCCRTDCCCTAGATAECSCTAPERVPLPAPTPKQPLAIAVRQPLPAPTTPTPPAPRLNCASSSALPAALLPHRTRQEALSVWRL